MINYDTIFTETLRKTVISGGNKDLVNNFHTHTYRCLHAYGTEEDYVLEAIDKGLGCLGFSDHAPFPDKDYGYRMKYEELDSYISAIDILKEKYGDKIKLYKGLEIEYHPRYSDYYRSLLNDRGLDYLALGEHQYTIGGEIKNIFFAESTADYTDYAKAVCMAIETGLFAYVAHPDIMFINNHEWDDRCDEACDMIIECASKHDTILEYNANGYRRNKQLFADGIRYPYPHERFWKKAKDAHIKVIVGSDCHSPDQICDEYMLYGIQEAKKAGLELINNIF